MVVSTHWLHQNRRTAPERLLWTRLTFSKSVMCLDVSEMAQTDLIFIDPGVKINGAYYREVFLTQKLLPVLREICGEFFVFQHTNAPGH